MRKILLILIIIPFLLGWSGRTEPIIIIVEEETPPKIEEPIKRLAPQYSCADIERISERVRGTPYVWGGHSPAGFDCSGFIWHIEKELGIINKRTTSRKMWIMNSNQERNWRDAKCGYYVWWTFTNNRPMGHVGVMVNSNYFWHSGSSTGVTKAQFVRNGYWDRIFNGAKHGML